MFCGVIFLWIVGKIVFSLFPMKMIFFLLTSITKPIKLHVHIFGSELYICVSYDAVGEYVVKLNWCWTLDVARFMQGIAKGKIVFAIDETQSSFRFLNRGHV